MQDFEKSIDKATRSLDLKPTIKGYYRRGKAYAALKKYEDATQDLKSAIMINTDDPNDIQVEYNKFYKLA